MPIGCLLDAYWMMERLLCDNADTYVVMFMLSWLMALGNCCCAQSSVYVPLYAPAMYVACM
jgi:hypothetical protein